MILERASRSLNIIDKEEKGRENGVYFKTLKVSFYNQEPL